MQAIGGKGKVIILEGVRGTLTAQDRLRGFKDAIAENPGVTLVASQPANYQRLQGMQVMENLLQAHPDVAGVLAANDAMAIGALDALADSGHAAQVIGINATREAIDAIKAGKMLASGDYNGFLQGCIGTMIALRAVRHESVPKNVALQVVVVDKSNYEPYAVPDRAAHLPEMGGRTAALSATHGASRRRWGAGLEAAAIAVSTSSACRGPSGGPCAAAPAWPRSVAAARHRCSVR